MFSILCCLVFHQYFFIPLFSLFQKKTKYFLRLFRLELQLKEQKISSKNKKQNKKPKQNKNKQAP